MSFRGDQLLGIDFARADTTAQHALGSRQTDNLGNEYVYVQAQGAIGIGVPVQPDGVPNAAGLPHDWKPSGNAGVIAGVGGQVALADNEFGWVQVRGYHDAAQLATTVADEDILSRVADANGDFVATAGAILDSVAIALEADTAGVGAIYIY
jgi:hypothetical protein